MFHLARAASRRVTLNSKLTSSNTPVVRFSLSKRSSSTQTQQSNSSTQKLNAFNTSKLFDQSKLDEMLSTIQNEVLSQGKVTSLTDLVALCESLHILFQNNPQRYDRARGFFQPSHMRYWFRGTSDEAHELIPSSFRSPPNTSEETLPGEDFFIKEFLVRYPENKNQDILSILAMMQHYNFRTRLLDWSGNIMVAAYFSYLDDDVDGRLWFLKPCQLNLSHRVSKSLGGIALYNDFDFVLRAISSMAYDSDEMLKDYSDQLYKARNFTLANGSPAISYENFCEQLHKLLAEQNIKDSDFNKKFLKPIAIEPGSLNERVVAQNGKFTVSGGRFYSKSADSSQNEASEKLFEEPIHLSDIKLEDLQSLSYPHSCSPNLHNAILANVIIPSDSKKNIRESLEHVLGIDISSLMKDMSSTASLVNNIRFR